MKQYNTPPPENQPAKPDVLADVQAAAERRKQEEHERRLRIKAELRRAHESASLLGDSALPSGKSKTPTATVSLSVPTSVLTTAAANGVVPPVIHDFGKGAASILQTEQTGTFIPFTPEGALNFEPQTPFDRLRDKPTPCPASIELLKGVSAAFVMLTAGGQTCAYHIASGDVLSREGFKQHCAAHYGVVALEWKTADSKDAPAARMEKPAPLGDYWWDHASQGRRVVRRIVMEPTSKSAAQDAMDNPEVFNLWHVRKLSMAVPDGHSTANDIAIIVNHVMYLSGGDVVGVTYFLCWLAHLYLHPEDKIPTAICLYSKNGRVGKNMLGKLIAKVFGKSLVAGCTGKRFQSNFMDAIEHKRILFINELARSEKADGYEDFKSQISEEDTQFEGKGRASKEIKNITHYVITTNNADALPLMEGDGRVLVLRCLADRQPDAYYKELGDWIDGPGAPALANVLANWEFPRGWDYHAPVPQTAAVKAMQRAARGDLVCTLEALMQEGVQPFDKDCGRVVNMTLQLDTACGAALRGIKVNHRTLPAALERLGAVQLGSGTASKDNAWFWRNQDYWRGKTAKELIAYIHDGTKPDDYPKTEGENHE
ncbi:primase-helicase family protein [Pseudomonas sp. CLCA07]